MAQPVPPLHVELREARGRADLNQTDAAELIGVSQATVSSWESTNDAIRVCPQAGRLESIAKAYRLPIDRLRSQWLRAVTARLKASTSVAA